MSMIGVPFKELKVKGTDSNRFMWTIFSRFRKQQHRVGEIPLLWGIKGSDLLAADFSSSPRQS